MKEKSSKLWFSTTVSAGKGIRCKLLKSSRLICVENCFRTDFLVAAVSFDLKNAKKSNFFLFYEFLSILFLSMLFFEISKKLSGRIFL